VCQEPWTNADTNLKPRCFIHIGQLLEGRVGGGGSGEMMRYSVRLRVAAGCLLHVVESASGHVRWVRLKPWHAAHFGMGIQGRRTGHTGGGLRREKTLLLSHSVLGALSFGVFLAFSFVSLRLLRTSSLCAKMRHLSELKIELMYCRTHSDWAWIRFDSILMA
jgi:hypothetical protein